MSSQPLNYCRQLAKQLVPLIKDKRTDEGRRAKFLNVLKASTAAQKFLLPPGGRLLDDFELKALDPEMELRLPHKVIALEFPSLEERLPVEMLNPSEGLYNVTKDIVLAWEMDDGVTVQRVSYSPEHQSWGIGEMAKIPRTGYLQDAEGGSRKFVMIPHFEGGRRDADEVDFHGPSALLCFLNALACSNIRVEKLHLPKLKKSIKSAFPFDEYHVLTIGERHGGSQKDHDGQSIRSPREHLRRGHIRRYESGLKIWVNATVVNAGIGNSVHKDYAVKGVA